MHPAYALSDAATVFSPALVFFPELIRQNIARVIEMAGGPARLRPHVKTHKTVEIAKMLLDAGVTKHKCATIAEAEMLASAGAPDVLIAYPLVGPNIERACALIRKFPGTRFSALIDDPDMTRALSSAMKAAGLEIGVVLDLDVGQHRTGIAIGDAARSLYELAGSLPGLRPEGFQLYDGHNSQPDRAEREKAVREFIQPVLELRAKAEGKGIPVPRLVCGGTPSFPVYAAMTDVPGIECSPGTFVLHDAGYGPKYADLSGITPAAVLVTRVISRPTANRVTLDLGNKAVAADPVLEKRVTLLDFPEYKTVGHNEEHLIVETAGASAYKPGDVVYALPGHICPTVALHNQVLVAEGGKVVSRWDVASRVRVLTV
ncbi:D-threonine aldolase [Gemmata sp. SH-PL17]|uniref:D-TA family PLP-dependent enzyme n=1 Tax=Gemmata sp. SH-PL17 TaxID=1630693 RepID=UPI0004AFC0F1|nr:D-TA family PLP-dependent enzyme [Gemmata sp. SH-PL17]AMV28870.1 D-threonine aldolase [Gemmata sp. SH-PL17]